MRDPFCLEETPLIGDAGRMWMALFFLFIADTLAGFTQPVDFDTRLEATELTPILLPLLTSALTSTPEKLITFFFIILVPVCSFLRAAFAVVPPWLFGRLAWFLTLSLAWLLGCFSVAHTALGMCDSSTLYF